MLFFKVLIKKTPASRIKTAFFCKRAAFVLAVCVMFCQPVYGMPRQEKNGKEREYYSNGKVKTETVFKKGLVVRSRTFYDNGQLKTEFRYKDGALFYSRTFYENGNRRSEWSRSAGIMKFYSLSGTLTHQSRLKEYNLN